MDHEFSDQERALGKIAFDAYSASKGGVTYDNKPIPPWGSVGPDVQRGWILAARAVKAVVLTPRLAPLRSYERRNKMSASKKNVRAAFRQAVYARAKYRCQGPDCTVTATAATAEELLDAHHVTDRTLMPHGGYVPENGIALCKAPGGCHEKAEQFHSTGAAYPGFAPEDLYRIIGSSSANARAASLRLGS